MKKLLSALIIFISLTTVAHAQADSVFSDTKNLLKTEKVRQIAIDDVPDFTIPYTLFYPVQIKKTFLLGDMYFALVQRANSAIPFPGETVTDTAGLFYAMSGDTSWKPFVSLQDTTNTPDSPRNTPLYFWSRGKRLFLWVTDGNGGGSGEGMAKLLSSLDGGKTWRIKRCIYLQEVELDFGTDPARAVRNYLKQAKKNNSYIIWEYSYNRKTGKFEAEQFNKGTGKKYKEVNESC